MVTGMALSAKAQAMVTPTPIQARSAIEILSPATQTAPVVFSSPHSGRDYPPDFTAESALDRVTLRRSEDGFVDELFAAAPSYGAPMLKALFPRVYVDPNREPYELDPTMFDEPLPNYANTSSPRVAAGLGTIARVVTNGEEIYVGKLRFAEVRGRIESLYRPYHAALGELIDTTKSRFGHCVLIDCHSMPSVGGPLDHDSGRRRVDFILGDAHGAACAPALTRFVEQQLRALGYAVARNAPYSGGYITRHYGRPNEGVHALQIEINRALYMDEDRVRPSPGLPPLAAHMERLAGAICGFDGLQLAAE